MPLKLMLLSEIRTEGDKWRYYAEDYAWRIIRLHDEKRTSPIDPEGEWYDETLVKDALNRFHRHIAAEKHRAEELESLDPDVQAMNRKYARAKAWREGWLDKYDAVHHPERLAERRRRAAEVIPEQPYSTPERAIGDVLAEMGISSKAAE
jgi:hypothetical protein